MADFPVPSGLTQEQVSQKSLKKLAQCACGAWNSLHSPSEMIVQHNLEDLALPQHA